ncbi:MAG: type IV secretory system conjugative DNA transfer family protein [Akkermansiaceae bacterium]
MIFQNKSPKGGELTPKKHLHADLLRGSALSETGQLSNTKFEDPEKLIKVEGLKHGDGKLFLGLLEANIYQRRDASTKRLSRYAIDGHAIGSDDDRHVITVAGSRAGKGVSAIIPNLLSYTGSVLAIDPKGELATVTARCRSKKLKQDIYVLDPFKQARGEAAKHRKSFNPIDILSLDSDTLVEDAGLIADALIVESGGDSHWDESAKNILEGIILHVATCTLDKYEKKRNLVTVYRLIMKQMNEELYSEMELNPIEDEAVGDAARAFFDKPEKERESVLSTLRRQVRFLGYRNMQSVLQHSDLDLAQLKDKPTTIYLCLPAMRLGTCSRWFRLFINLTLARMEYNAKKPKTPVLLCLDEFAVLGHMKTIEDAAGQIAGFGCRLWPILQDLGQLKALYKERWQTFMGNAATLQFFGNSDMETLEWVSSRLGETTVTQVSKSDVTYEQRTASGATGESSSIQSHKLMTPEEISRWFGREDRQQRQLVIRAGFLPMILQRACYYEDARFKDLADPPPSEHKD